MAELLLGKNPKIDKRDQYGYTPLHWAVHEDKLELVKLFLKEGAKANTLNDWKHSIIYTAVDRGVDAEIVKILLEAGAKPNQKNNDGQTPYNLAKWLERSEIAELLKSAINKKNNKTSSSNKRKASSKCGSAVARNRLI